MRIAFASNDGILLADSHFGDAKYFYIYEIDKEGYKFIEKRENTTGEELEHGDEMKARSITSILRDVHVLVGYRMGPNVNRIKKHFLPIVSRHKRIERNIEILNKNYNIISELYTKKNIIVIIELESKLRIIY